MTTDDARLIYRFTLRDGTIREFPVRFDPVTLKACPRPRASYPDWTKLSFCRCPNCPLDEAQHPRCPTAENVVDVVEAFKDSLSIDSAVVDIIAQSRTYQKLSALTDGVAALMGVLMATSACPVLGLLRPNVLTHLPFATAEETVYRTLTMYLMAQFFVSRGGGKGDWTLSRIDKMLEEVHLVNRHFSERLKQTCLKDVNINAVVRLDTFAALTVRAARKMADRLEPMFDAYLTRVP